MRKNPGRAVSGAMVATIVWGTATFVAGAPDRTALPRHTIGEAAGICSIGREGVTSICTIYLLPAA